ncbi:MAG: sulfatase-like hydrolase/transferase [Candidatus Pacebacteria bacterium]|nr:sulfatase-like hydrolase/transferase [Candidatus Paceibacterota bacterium]
MSTDPGNTTEKPRNVLFVFADQMHAFAMGCMGNKSVLTPNLDRLAEKGALFDSCYSCNAVCTPYRAALFTGRYSSQTGIINNDCKPIPEGERTIADCLNDHSVHTSYVGKWHIGKEPGRRNVGVPPHLRGGFTDFIGYQCWNDFIQDVLFFDEDGNERRCDKHRLTAATDIALERLGRIRDEPFAMFVSYQAPHKPVQPSEEYVRLYDDIDIELPPNFQEIEGAHLGDGAAYPWEGYPEYLKEGTDTVHYIKLYNAIITQMDAQIGRLMSQLEEWGIADSTMVVFTSDHGDLQGCHGLRNKHAPFEYSTRVPLIIYNPQGPAGVRVSEHIGTVDFLPTILDWCGAPPSPLSEGRSLLPFTRGETVDGENMVFSENFLRRFPYRMLVKDNIKLVVHAVTGEATHLFDLTHDPYEMNNLVDNPDWAAKRDELHQRLDTFYVDIVSRRNPNAIWDPLWQTDSEHSPVPYK